MAQTVIVCLQTFLVPVSIPGAFVNLGVIPRRATGNAVGAVCRAVGSQKNKMGHCPRSGLYSPAVGSVPFMAD